MQEIVERLVADLKSGRTEIYNEFSLQHEIGILIRQDLPAHNVQFERNTSFFRFEKAGFVKREIDISVFSDVRNPLQAVEFKFPRNGQYPEEMFKFCQDIMFLEQLVEAGFGRGYFLVFVDDPLFYRGGKVSGIYAHFRDGVPLTGEILKPTGSSSEIVTIRGSYQIEWKPAFGDMKYMMIEVS